jgi:DNA-directed RNA polymerase specialized sigma24 family protein
MNATSRGTIEEFGTEAADLYWMCFVLTGRQDQSIEITADVVAQDYPSGFFSEWKQGWSRRTVLARAIEAIRHELVESARRTEIERDEETGALSALSASEEITKADIEEALRGIDPFPRAALVLLVFEGIPIADAITLLDADAALIRKAQGVGLRGFTANIVPKKGLPAPTGSPETIKGSITC